MAKKTFKKLTGLTFENCWRSNRDGLIKALVEMGWISSKHTTWAAYMVSKSWKKRRLKILARDKYKCRICTKRATQVHHRLYSARSVCGSPGRSKRHIFAVCSDCHYQIHRNEEGGFTWDRKTPEQHAAA